MEFLHGVLYIAALGVASHIVGQLLPRRLILWRHFPFSSFRWENRGRIYERLHIREWKNVLPDMSRIMPDMVPKRLPANAGSQEVEVLIRETCVAELIHVVLILVSPTIIHFCRRWYGVLLCVIFALGNVPFILIQRYNRPKLAAVYGRMKRREELKDHG